MKTCPRCDTQYPNEFVVCASDSCGAPLSMDEGLVSGTVIRKKYRIVKWLGAGGFGAVYLAEHIDLQEHCALKFLSTECVRNQKSFERFRQEAKAARKLRHPNVAEVFDLDWSDEGVPFIAMECVRGPELTQEIRPGGMEISRALAIARGVGLGLGAAHANGIVHRDVKPNNIMLANPHLANETPKLLDFGIAAMEDGGDGRNVTRGWLLTPEYASPEQWKFMPADQMDGRVDLYALGAVLFEMLTGQACVRGNSMDAAMQFHLSAERTAPSRLRPEIRNWPGLDELVLRMLSTDRELRPADCDAFVRELDAVREGHSSFRPRQVRTVEESRRVTVNDSTPPVAKGKIQPQVSEKAPSTSRRRWMLVATAGAVLVVLAAWGMVYESNKRATSTHEDTAARQTAITAGSILENPRDGLRYVWVPPGDFMMGCSPGDTNCRTNEEPTHAVSISRGFWMTQTPVTVAAWGKYRTATGAGALPYQDDQGRSNWNEHGSADRPVVMANWQEASNYCTWAGMRLPTEAEWEYAARAGSQSAQYGDLDAIAWYGDNSGNQRIDAAKIWSASSYKDPEYERKLRENGNTVHPVGLKRANAWGLYDTLGNVDEWVSDWYADGYYRISPGTDPAGPPAGEIGRVVRGTSWGNMASFARVSVRQVLAPEGHWNRVGFRCVGTL